MRKSKLRKLTRLIDYSPSESKMSDSEMFDSEMSITEENHILRKTNPLLQN